MTITLAAVYAPIGFVSGLTGSLFREFAFTLAGAVIVSGVIALTLSPMMCSKLLSSELHRRALREVPRPHLRAAEAPLSAPPRPHAQLPPGDAARARRRHRHDRASCTRRRRRSWRPRKTRASSSTWSRRRRPPTSTTSSRSTTTSTTSSAPCPRRSTCSPSTAWAATCTRPSPASCSSRGRSATARRRRSCRTCSRR